MMFIVFLVFCNQECNNVFVLEQDESVGTADLDPHHPTIACPGGDLAEHEKYYVLICTGDCNFNNNLFYCVKKNDLDDFIKNSCCKISKQMNEYMMLVELDCDGSLFKDPISY